jgi:hypothetical protein
MPLSYLDTDSTLTANSDTKVTSQKAIKTYVASTFNKVVELLAVLPTVDCAVGDGAGYFRVPALLNSMVLSAVDACCITAGTTGVMTIQIHNLTRVVDMLTTRMTIDSGETDTLTAATPAVIDTSNDDVSTGNVLRVDIDTAHSTPAKGLLVSLTFAKA